LSSFFFLILVSSVNEASLKTGLRFPVGTDILFAGTSSYSPARFLFSGHFGRF